MTQINKLINNWNDALGEGRHRQGFSREFLTLKQPCEYSQSNYSFWISPSYFSTLASIFKAKKLYKMQRREIHDLPVRLLRKEWENYALAHGYTIKKARFLRRLPNAPISLVERKNKECY